MNAKNTVRKYRIKIALRHPVITYRTHRVTRAYKVIETEIVRAYEYDVELLAERCQVPESALRNLLYLNEADLAVRMSEAVFTDVFDQITADVEGAASEYGWAAEEAYAENEARERGEVA